MNRLDTEKCWRMAITGIATGQSYATRLGEVVPQDELERALAKVDSAILDFEQLRDRWRNGQ